MELSQLESQFNAMGARFKSQAIEDLGPGGSNFVIDLRRDQHGQFFELRLFQNPQTPLEVEVLQARPRERHLLLMVRRDDTRRRLDRFLCGHDEREWFIATVPGRVSSVAQAMESLKPEPILEAQSREGLKARQRNSRKNRAFRRQGEWFFVPAPELRPDPNRILRDEPIRRGGGKPHFVGELVREGGVDVWVSRVYPNGLLDEEYRQLVRSDPASARLHWRRMRRDPAVYARGEIRHPDHRTITLPVWHRVLMNTESRSGIMGRMAFLD